MQKVTLRAKIKSCKHDAVQKRRSLQKLRINWVEVDSGGNLSGGILFGWDFIWVEGVRFGTGVSNL